MFLHTNKLYFLHTNKQYFCIQINYISAYKLTLLLHTNKLLFLILDMRMQKKNGERFEICYFSCSINTQVTTGCPNKHGNSETKTKSSLFRFRVAMPKFNGQNKFMSVRVHFLNRF